MLFYDNLSHLDLKITGSRKKRRQKIYVDKHYVNEYTQTYEEIIVNLCVDDSYSKQMSMEEYVNKKLQWYKLNDDTKQSVNADTKLGLF